MLRGASKERTKDWELFDSVSFGSDRVIKRGKGRNSDADI
jgi:hypothetical protein